MLRLNLWGVRWRLLQHVWVLRQLLLLCQPGLTGLSGCCRLQQQAAVGSVGARCELGALPLLRPWKLLSSPSPSLSLLLLLLGCCCCCQQC